MKYEALVRDVPQNEVEIVKMNDGSLIQCKKIPLATVENMDTLFGGVKRALDTTKDSLNYIATCGSTKLYSAAGDVSTYMKGKNGNILSASIGKNGKISG